MMPASAYVFAFLAFAARMDVGHAALTPEELAARQEEVANAKLTYPVSFQHLDVPLLGTQVPLREMSTNLWVLEFISQRGPNPYRPPVALPPSFIQVLLNDSRAPEQVYKLRAVTEAIFGGTTVTEEEFAGEPVTAISEYDAVHDNDFRQPRGLHEMTSDQAFARYRLSGAVPLALRKATLGLLVKMGLFKYNGGCGLKARALIALLLGRLYAVDYSTPVEREHLSPGQNMATPVALFAIPTDAAKNEREGLEVLCVQVHKGVVSSIATPADNTWAWTYAKMVFNSAEAQYHESEHHLTTHVVAEAVGISMKRSLPEAHPIYTLIDNHMFGTFVINQFAVNLLNDGGAVDRIMALSAEKFRNLTSKAALDMLSDDFTYPTMMKDAKLDKKYFKTAYYPYREFSDMMWSGIHGFVEEFLAVYYPSDEAVDNDTELEAFRQELIDNKVGWVEKSWTRGGGARAFLTEFLSGFIYVASVQHAAVGVPQYDAMTVQTVAPTLWWDEPPMDISTIASEADLVKALPNLKTAFRIRDFMATLTTTFRTFSSFSPDVFEAGAARDAATAFKAQLETIEADMVARNAHWVSLWDGNTDVPQELHGNWAYTAILPSLTPMSVNA